MNLCCGEGGKKEVDTVEASGSGMWRRVCRLFPFPPLFLHFTSSYLFPFSSLLSPLSFFLSLFVFTSFPLPPFFSHPQLSSLLRSHFPSLSLFSHPCFKSRQQTADSTVAFESSSVFFRSRAKVDFFSVQGGPELTGIFSPLVISTSHPKKSPPKSHHISKHFLSTK